jgi:hypothetical protein
MNNITTVYGTRAAYWPFSHLVGRTVLMKPVDHIGVYLTDAFKIFGGNNKISFYKKLLEQESIHGLSLVWHIYKGYTEE